MKYFKIFVVLWISISCTNGKVENVYPPLSYSLDTVRINSNGETLDLTRSLLISNFDFKKNSIFTYNQFDHSVDEIDLEKLTFAKKYLFEKDGPNGTGQNLNNIIVLKDGRFFLKSFEKSLIFDNNGILQHKVDWINSKDSSGSKYSKLPGSEVLVELEVLKAFGIGYNYSNKEIYLDILTIGDNTVKRLDINPKKSYTDLILAIDNTADFIDPRVYLKYENNTIILSYEFSNEIVLIDPKEDLLKFKDYNPKMTPQRVKRLTGNSISSREQLQIEFQSYLEQVEYFPPVWDELNKQYFRLSTTTVFYELEDDKALVPKTKEKKVYLSIFDEEFNLINELEIPEISYSSGKYFAKNGSLWLFTNLDDEMGFVRVGLSQ